MVSHWLFRHPLRAAGVQKVFKTISALAWHSKCHYRVLDCNALDHALIHTAQSTCATWTTFLLSHIITRWEALDNTKLPYEFNPQRYESHSIDPKVMRRIVLFSKMSPPEALVTIILQNNRVTARVFSSCGSDTEDIFVDDEFQNGVWYRAGISVGSFNADGARVAYSFSGATEYFDYVDWMKDWCSDEIVDFIQGMQVPGM